MNYKIHKGKNADIVEVCDPSVVLKNSKDFLDLTGNVPSNRIILYKHNLADDFFDLKSGIAGDILQKVSNYNLKLGIVGDFSLMASKSLGDFIYESNKNKQVVFKNTIEEILELLV
jgi:hypothetical protein